MEDTIILTQSEVQACLSMSEAIEAVKVAYSAFAKGRVQMPSVQHLDVHQYNGEVDIKSGFVEDFGLMGTKIASGFYENQKKGLPPGIAVIVLLDLETSMPLAIMDGTYITAYRTGAAGAVAASGDCLDPGQVRRDGQASGRGRSPIQRTSRQVAGVTP